jgi:hypothetical protein
MSLFCDLVMTAACVSSSIRWLEVMLLFWPHFPPQIIVQDIEFTVQVTAFILLLQLISYYNFSLNIAYFVVCEVQKFKLKFTSLYVHKASDWSLNKSKPIKCIVYKPVCEYDYELLNFPTKFATFREKLCEINCKCIPSLVDCFICVLICTSVSLEKGGHFDQGTFK